MLWRARITNYALLPYANRAKFFPDNKYFTDGYEFYGGGIFSNFSLKDGYGEVPQLPQLEDIETTIDSGYVKTSNFDWRKVHGADDNSSFYFDNNPDSLYAWNTQAGSNIWFYENGNGWLTSVKQQTTYSGGIADFIYPSTRVCPNGCFIYGPVSSTESCFNLFNNAHHDYDLSEQYIMELGYDAVTDDYEAGTCINNYVNRPYPYDTLTNAGDSCFLTDTFYTYNLHVLDSVLFIATTDTSLIFTGNLNDLQVCEFDTIINAYVHRDTIYVGVNYIVYDNYLINPTYMNGGSPNIIFNYISDYGIVNESFLTWQDTLLFGDTIMLGQQLDYRVKISDYTGNISNENDVKYYLINNGPGAGLPREGHTCTLVGFGTVSPGDTIDLDGGWGNNEIVVPMFHPYVGQTYWIFKEQNGLTFGDGGYVKIIIGKMYNRGYGFPFCEYVSGDVYDTENNITTPVYDADGDGYCFWGLGNKPAGCDTCPDEPDCNDNNPLLHHYDNNMRCMPDCDSLSSLTSTIPSVIVSDTTIKDDFILYNIIVSNNAILTLQGDIFLNDDVKITVNHGSTLYLKGAHLQSYCGNNWEGIIVKGNKDSSLGPTGNAMLTASGAILEDAECAISGDVGAIVNAQGCTFRFNELDVSLRPVVLNAYSFQVNNFTNADFINCKFYTFCDTLINYEISNVGLLCVKGVEFKNCHFKDWRVDGDTAYFRSGIFCLYSGCKAYISESLTPVSFENMEYGIFGHSTQLLPVEIENYNFENCLRGIYLNNSYNAYIVNNTFNIPNRDEIPDEIPYGIYMDVCKNFRIENNKLSVGLRSGQPVHYATPCETFAGIITKDCDESTDEIYRNYFYKNATAVQAIGENKDYNYDEHGITVKCNEFYNNSYDIFVTPDIYNPYADTLNTGIAQYQGSDNFPAGNLFTDSVHKSYPHFSINWGNFTNICNDAEFFNYYYNDTTGYPRVYPLHVADSGVVNLIDTHIILTDSTCPDRTIDTTGGGGIGGGVIKSAQLKTSINYYTSQLANLTDGGNTELTIAEIVLANDYTAWQTYLSLMNKSPYLSDKALKEVAAKEEGLTTPMVRDVLVANPQAAKSNEVQAILNERIEELPDYMIEQINSGRTNISPREFLEMRKAECTAEYSRIINNRIRYIAKTPGLSLQDSVEYYLNSLDIPVFHYMLSDFYASMGDYNSAISELNNINYTGSEIPPRIQESTAFYTMLSQWQTDSVNLMALDSSKLQMLEYYETGHPTVAAKARSLLFLNNSCDYEEPIYYPSQITSRKMRVINETEKETGYFNVYPNPATDFVQVSWKCAEDTEATGIKIFNIQSHNIYSQRISGQENIILIPVKDYKPGVYSCILTFANGVNETKKFTIVK
jgi:hypothetical protein